MNRANHLDKKIHSYIIENGVRITPVQRKLMDHTMKMKDVGGLVGTPDVTQLLQLLVRATNVRRIVEVGCLTGCTTVPLAQALPEDGRIITIDHNERTINEVRPLWREANVENKVS
jgi:caffeoyl-CoA O-methyltransferase